MGYFINHDPLYGPVGEVQLHLTYADFLQVRFAEAEEVALSRFEAALVKLGPRSSMHLLRQCLVGGDALRAEAGRSDDSALRAVAEATLTRLLIAYGEKARAFARGADTSGSAKGRAGRPLDASAPQDRIVDLVRQCAADPEFQHGDGRPKPTKIRDWIMREHPEAAGGPSGGIEDRAMFDRVRRALKELGL